MARELLVQDSLRRGRRAWMVRHGLFGALAAVLSVLVASLTEVPVAGSRTFGGIALRLGIAVAVFVPGFLRHAAREWEKLQRPSMERWKAARRAGAEDSGARRKHDIGAT